MFGKCVRSFMEQMGILAFIFTFLSLIFPDKIQPKLWYFAVCIVVPIHFFGFFTFQLRLFSSRIWVRRMIVISFSIFIMIAMNYLFGYFRLEFDYLIVLGIALLFFIIWAVFAYYVADKIEQQNLKLINQKLDEKNQRK